MNMCKQWAYLGVFVVTCLVLNFERITAANDGPAGRPPAVPLVVHDPYFSIWSFGDLLAKDWPRHWTGRIHALCSLIRIDGKPYRLMGTAPTDIPPLEQTSLEVTPTSTTYTWRSQEVEVQLRFLTPVLPDDLAVLSRPLSYLIWHVRSLDGKKRTVDIYFDVTGEIAVNEPEQKVVWSRGQAGDLDWLRIGTTDQKILGKKGDDLRIDWGYAYVAVQRHAQTTMVVSDHETARNQFCNNGRIPRRDDSNKPRPANDRWPVLALMHSGQLTVEESLTWKAMLAYDDLFSIEYMGQKLRPYWRKQFTSILDLLISAHEEFPDLLQRCHAFDRELLGDAQKLGGTGYANLIAISYRHTLGAHKLVEGPQGEPMLFSKECFSNGCIGTVDVIYPAAPIFMLFNNTLLKASVVPVLDYAAGPRWKFPFAPHDLGTYPLANGQVYGGGEASEKDQMPVEESANMLIMVYAISRLDGNPAFAQQYGQLLDRWARYLEEKGFDPENQLCTDDFTGPLAHNCNLSVKAALALACYAEICRMMGKAEEATKYRKLAEEFAAKWVEAADDGDHYRLAFDKPGTWSQKYNLVWDKLFNLNIFPQQVRQKEIAFYKRQLQPYGLPLDNRALFTKTDWEVWTATLADSREDFDALMQPLYRFVDETPDRVPLTDWYWTHDAKLRGFRARPVIGGVFIKFLESPELWQKWASRPGQSN
ncbi:MAG: glutaminase domain-containing protein [Thermogutta sp.]